MRDTGATAEAERGGACGAAPAQVALARGAGVGPEIADAVLAVLEAAGARIALREVTLGREAGGPGGVPAEALAAIRGAGVLLKGPLDGGAAPGLRSALGLFCAVRRVRSFAPALPSRHPGMDVVVIRETEEDLPCGPEHRQTEDVAQALKRISRPACRRVCRFAFAWAEAADRRRVACVTKANAMPITDGLFREVFGEVAAEHPALSADALLVDTAAARLAEAPERLDTLLAPNLYGDILADLATGLAGHLQLGASARHGTHASVFEPIHGAARPLAGRGAANPSGMLLAAAEMLRHLGQGAAAARVENAWARTIEDGLHTPDLFAQGRSRRRVSTLSFARAVIARLGERPRRLAAAGDGALPLPAPAPEEARGPADRRLAGVDLFVAWPERDGARLAARLDALGAGGLRLRHLANRGETVWPRGEAPALVTDQWRARFTGEPGASTAGVAELMRRAAEAGLEVVKTENLYSYGGVPGFTAAEGETP
jgi:isocitrate dehydrogenase